MKFSSKNKKMTALIAATIAVCITAGTATAAYAYYVNKQLSQSNTISIGKTVETIVIGADSTSENQELYPGDSATFTYPLEVENYAGSATVTTALSTGEADTNFDAAYFTVTYTVSEDQTVYSNDKPYTVTSADNGKNIVVTVTMNDEEPCYTFANMPTRSLQLPSRYLLSKASSDRPNPNRLKLRILLKTSPSKATTAHGSTARLPMRGTAPRQ